MAPKISLVIKGVPKNFWKKRHFPANIYLFKLKNKDIRKRCEIHSKLAIKIPFSTVCIIDFEQVNVAGFVATFSEHILLNNIHCFKGAPFSW